MSYPRGEVAILYGEYTDGIGAFADPLNPLVTITDPSATVIVLNAVPTEDYLGHFHYNFGVPADAPLGLWTITWTGTVFGEPVEGGEEFLVTAARPSLASLEGGSCTCASTDLRLPLVNTVDAVFIDGELLSPDAYELYDRTKLVRVDGGTWPCCQALSVNPDALVVVATAGTPVPEMGKLAVIEMACQIGALGTAACKLPTRVQTITRQGVSWTVLDPQDFLDNGRTGLYLGDLFLAAVNPAGVRNRVRVVSPDTPRISVPS